VNECEPLNPGQYYACLGAAIAQQTLPLVLPNRSKIAWWCYREAAEVHNNPVGRALHSFPFQLNWSFPVQRIITKLNS
jgi:hypothetical protein